MNLVRRTKEKIAKIRALLDGCEKGLGVVSDRFDAALARRVDHLHRALTMDDTIEDRDLIDFQVRGAAARLAGDDGGALERRGLTLRKRGRIRDPRGAERLADEILDDWAPLPLGTQLLEARAELAAAIEALSVRGRPKKGTSRAGASHAALNALFQKLGFLAVSGAAVRKARQRRKPRDI